MSVRTESRVETDEITNHTGSEHAEDVRGLMKEIDINSRNSPAKNATKGMVSSCIHTMRFLEADNARLAGEVEALKNMVYVLRLREKGFMLEGDELVAIEDKS